MVRVHRISYSTNVERVALAAGYKGIELEWVDHEPEDRSAIVALSGQELVPVAEIDGEVVRGSMRIVERLERELPEPALYPSDAAATARAAIFLDWFDRVWKGPPNALDSATPVPDGDLLMRRARGWTDRFEGLLAAGPFLAGEALGVEDVCAFPFLKYAVVDPVAGDDEPFHGILVEILRNGAHPRLDEWVARVDELPRA